MSKLNISAKAFVPKTRSEGQQILDTNIQIDDEFVKYYKLKSVNDKPDDTYTMDLINTIRKSQPASNTQEKYISNIQIEIKNDTKIYRKCIKISDLTDKLVQTLFVWTLQKEFTDEIEIITNGEIHFNCRIYRTTLSKTSNRQNLNGTQINVYHTRGSVKYTIFIHPQNETIKKIITYDMNSLTKTYQSGRSLYNSSVEQIDFVDDLIPGKY